jgi:HSP20 family protein
MLNLIPLTKQDNNYCVSNDFDQLFDSFFKQSWIPNTNPLSMKVNILDKGEIYELEAEIPGFSKEEISIEIKNNILTISANTSTKKDIENSNYIRKERSNSLIKRNFNIKGIQTKNITANYNNGLLTIYLPKETDNSIETHTIEIN